jgi:hypothetical protein
MIRIPQASRRVPMFLIGSVSPRASGYVGNFAWRAEHESDPS